MQTNDADYAECADCGAALKKKRATARRRSNLRARMPNSFCVRGNPALRVPADTAAASHPLHQAMMVALIEAMKASGVSSALKGPGIFAHVLDFFKAAWGGELVKAVEKDVINRLRISPLEYVAPAAPRPPPPPLTSPAPHLVSFAPRTRTRRRSTA